MITDEEIAADAREHERGVAELEAKQNRPGRRLCRRGWFAAKWAASTAAVCTAPLVWSGGTGGIAHTPMGVYGQIFLVFFGLAWPVFFFTNSGAA